MLTDQTWQVHFPGGLEWAEVCQPLSSSLRLGLWAWCPQAWDLSKSSWFWILLWVSKCVWEIERMNYAASWTPSWRHHASWRICPQDKSFLLNVFMLPFIFLNDRYYSMCPLYKPRFVVRIMRESLSQEAWKAKTQTYKNSSLFHSWTQDFLMGEERERRIWMRELNPRTSLMIRTPLLIQGKI